MAELTGYEAAVRMTDADAEPEGPGEVERRGKAEEAREAAQAEETEEFERSEEAETLRDDRGLWAKGGERRGSLESGGAWNGTTSRLGAGGPDGSPDEEPPGDAVAVVPVVVGPVRSRMFEPRLVPPPLRPERVYGGWVPVAAKSGVRRTEEDPSEPGRLDDAREANGTDGAGETDVVVPIKTRPQGSRGPRKVALPPSVALEPRGERTPPLAPPEPRDGCSAEWKGTWLWEVCKKRARQEV
ncbi:hypothetical protein [Streptosporangium sp. LJ11]|uniref:hypothetical protein n=1 Tax=Streptosporangium sp. LJ11 TaxID=3436927 RepID=UPI003F7938A0